MSSHQRLLDIRPEERRNSFAAFAALFVLTSGHTLLETARDALFLTRLPPAQLPWMYLVIAALALSAARVRLRATRTAIGATILLGAGATAGLWVYGRLAQWPPALLYVLYVWSGLFVSWVTVQLWTLLGRAYTMTQAKRLYGFIGAGAVLGAVAGAFAARAAITVLPPGRLVLLAAVLFTGAVLPVAAIRAPKEAEEPAQQRVDGAQGSMSTNATLLASDRFARRVLYIVLSATIAFTLGDYLFKARIAEAYREPEALAAWLSTFYAVTNTTALVAQIVVGPWIFRTFGVQRALFVFPLLLLGAAGSVLATAGALVFAVSLKGLDGTLRYSLHKTSMELLLVPVPDGTRERVKPIIELVGNRGGQAIASLAILGLVAIGAANYTTLAAIVLLLAALWLANVVTIRSHYLDVFRETLRAGGLSGKAELPELDLGALELLFSGLNSSYDAEVLASLDLLAEQHRERLIPALILYHPSRDVVLRSLDLFARRGRSDFVSIADRLNQHPDRAVAAAALRARTAVAPDRALLEERLGDVCPQVAVTALVALFARGWMEPADFDRRMKEAIDTRSWQTAAEIARAIRDLGSNDASAEERAVAERFDDALIRVAREAGSFARREPELGARGTSTMPLGPPGILEIAIDSRIRLEVAQAMKARRRPGYLPILVGMLNRHELRAAAREAIAAIPGALDFVDDVLKQREFARDVRVHLPRTLSLFEPALAAKKLVAHLLSERDGAVRFKVLRALIKLRRASANLSLDGEVLRSAADATLDHIEELGRWRTGLVAGESDAPPPSAMKLDPLQAAHHLLVDLVRDKELHATQRLFMLLELLYAEDFEEIERGLRSKKPKKRASSLELVENIVGPPLRGRVLGVVGEAHQRTSSAEAPSYEEVLREMLARGGSTMRTLAEYRALELGIDPSTVPSRRSAQAKTIDSLGKRLVDRARDLLPEPSRRPSRAPA